MLLTARAKIMKAAWTRYRLYYGIGPFSRARFADCLRDAWEASRVRKGASAHSLQVLGLWSLRHDCPALLREIERRIAAEERRTASYNGSRHHYACLYQRRDNARLCGLAVALDAERAAIAA